MREGLDFASWFSYQLKRRDWIQSDFIHESGIASSTVSQWSTGKRIPDPEACLKIAEVFHVDPDLVLINAGHRPNVEDLKPDDPRTDLIAMVRRVQWTAEREALIRAQLDVMIKAGNRSGSGD